jgi:hypothetical protein
MSRFDWLAALKGIVQDNFRRVDLLSKLHLTKAELSLETPEVYASRTAAAALSFEEVIRAIEQLPQDLLPWDTLIDTVVSIKPPSKVHSIESRTAKATPTFKEQQCDFIEEDSTQFSVVDFVAPFTEGRYERTRMSNEGMSEISAPHALILAKSASAGQFEHHLACDLSLQKDPFTTLSSLSQGLLYLSLAGTNLASVGALPSSLQVLNLSSNKLESLDLTLPNLKLLNLSQNQLSKANGVQKCLSLRELWVSYNQISSVSNLCRLTYLRLLDLGHNHIQNLEDIATLTICNKLTAVSFIGNPLATRPSYETSIKTLLYKIPTVDPLDLTKLSEFNFLGTLPYFKAEPKATRAPLSVRNRSPGVPMRFGSPAVKKQPVVNRSPNTSPCQPRSYSSISENLEVSKRRRSSKYTSESRGESSTATSPATTDRVRDLSRPAVRKRQTSSTLEVSRTADFLDEVEKRLKSDNRHDAPAMSLARSVVITQEAIQKARVIKYNNPISALMIKPTGRSASAKKSRGSLHNSTGKVPARTVQFSLKRF